MDIEIYTPNLEPIGALNYVESLMWTEQYNVTGAFTLTVTSNDENNEQLQMGYIIRISNSYAFGVIEYLLAKSDSNGIVTKTIKGRLGECYLGYRIILDTYTATDRYASQIIYDLIEQNVTTPDEPARKIDLTQTSVKYDLGNKLTVQTSYKNLLEYIHEICVEQDLGIKANFYPKKKFVEFQVYQGQDLVENRVIFSTDNDDVSNSEYYENKQEYFNLAIVKGEGESDARVTVIVGETSGLSRQELYADARDLQQYDYLGDPLMSDSKYDELLTQRGSEKLKENQIVMTFTADIMSDGQFKLNTDYFLGDKVIVEDKRIGIRTETRITAIRYIYEKGGTSVELTFGFEELTIIERLQKGGL